ncbi:MAG TPA: VOC family protein [Thermoleophilaceae bacterium]
MFDHVTIRVSDRKASERFYDAVLATLGIDRTYRTREFSEWQDFQLAGANGANPLTQRLHIGFVAPSREQVDDFWRAGVDAGYRDDGRPGPRPEYSDDYYGGFLLDPDGNSAEAVHLDGLREGGAIDHIWIRVADLAAARRFYETIGTAAGFGLGYESSERVRFGGEDGSFSLLAGTPTENLHMAFPANADGDVDSFHRTAIEAGYRDHGPPGERPRYHPGYYASYILDPDGNNIEVVNHNRP